MRARGVTLRIRDGAVVFLAMAVGQPMPGRGRLGISRERERIGYVDLSHCTVTLR